MKIRILTDSASDLADAGFEGLTVLPMNVRFGTEEYLDGVNLSHHAFYEKLIECESLPATSQISPFAFAQAFQAAQAAGEAVIVITISSRLSGTYQSAGIAAQECGGEIYLVDSETVCVGQRILVEYACRLAKNGMDARSIAAALENEKKRVCLVALLDTLEYLRRGGRISKTKGVVGEMLSIKPVIGIKDGEVVMLGNARGSKNGNNLLTQQIAATGGIDFAMPYALGYTGLNDTLLQKYIQDNAHIWKAHTDSLPIGTVGGTIGTHAGPGAIAVAFFRRIQI